MFCLGKRRESQASPGKEPDAHLPRPIEFILGYSHHVALAQIL